MKGDLGLTPSDLDESDDDFQPLVPQPQNASSPMIDMDEFEEIVQQLEKEDQPFFIVQDTVDGDLRVTFHGAERLINSDRDDLNVVDRFYVGKDKFIQHRKFFSVVAKPVFQLDDILAEHGIDGHEFAAELPLSDISSASTSTKGVQSTFDKLLQDSTEFRTFLGRGMNVPMRDPLNFMIDLQGMKTVVTPLFGDTTEWENIMSEWNDHLGFEIINNTAVFDFPLDRRSVSFMFGKFFPPPIATVNACPTEDSGMEVTVDRVARSRDTLQKFDTYYINNFNHDFDFSIPQSSPMRGTRSGKFGAANNGSAKGRLDLKMKDSEEFRSYVIEPNPPAGKYRRANEPEDRDLPVVTSVVTYEGNEIAVPPVVAPPARPNAAEQRKEKSKPSAGSSRPKPTSSAGSKRPRSEETGPSASDTVELPNDSKFVRHDNSKKVVDVTLKMVEESYHQELYAPALPYINRLLSTSGLHITKDKNKTDSTRLQTNNTVQKKVTQGSFTFDDVAIVALVWLGSKIKELRANENKLEEDIRNTSGTAKWLFDQLFPPVFTADDVNKSFTLDRNDDGAFTVIGDGKVKTAKQYVWTTGTDKLTVPLTFTIEALVDESVGGQKVKITIPNGNATTRMKIDNLINADGGKVPNDDNVREWIQANAPEKVRRSVPDASACPVDLLRGSRYRTNDYTEAMIRRLENNDFFYTAKDVEASKFEFAGVYIEAPKDNRTTFSVKVKWKEAKTMKTVRQGQYTSKEVAEWVKHFFLMLIHDSQKNQLLADLAKCPSTPAMLFRELFPPAFASKTFEKQSVVITKSTSGELHLQFSEADAVTVLYDPGITSWTALDKELYGKQALVAEVRDDTAGVKKVVLKLGNKAYDVDNWIVAGQQPKDVKEVYNALTSNPQFDTDDLFA